MRSTRKAKFTAICSLAVTRTGPSEHQLFRMPKDADTFSDLVLDRCRSLINTGIWAGVDGARLETWHASFETDLDRYFGSCLLDALIFRSPDQTRALMEQLFQRSIPDHIRRHIPTKGPSADWYDILRQDQSTEPGIRLVPVIRPSDPPTKSGPTLAREYRRHLQLDERWMIWPEDIPKAVGSGVRVLIFVDDMLGTGSQFMSFFRQFDLHKLPQDVYLVYAPLVAHAKGLARLRMRLPHVHLLSAERLDEHCGVFAASSQCFDDGVNTPNLARAHYSDFLLRRSLNFGSTQMGFGQLALAYSFAHATPNNSLPLFWANRTTWPALFER